MASIARVVIPGMPHHGTQRGNRRQQTFFCDDRLVQVAPLLAMIGDWRAFLDSAFPEEELRKLREHGRTGRPLGSPDFLDRLEGLLGRILRPLKRGPKGKSPMPDEENGAN